MRVAVALLWFSLLGPAEVAHAFCGFYVAGADAKLYANATMVVLMREGTRTVLSMQNNYEGPAEAFALVIPVPTVLKKEQVKTLPKAVFERVDALGAPRLVEYWERDPCAPEPEYELLAMRSSRAAGSIGTLATKGTGVTIEAQFEVGEYNVVILSAKDSSGLERWLHDNKYNIPAGASDALAPYVAQGTKFFVAKVDPARVKLEHGQAVLSPLRFHYDAQDLSLPVRLGLLNSHGSQDLIVNILAKERYEVANYPNITIPTNLSVQDAVRDQFGAFYESLFQRTQATHKGAVVTEYSWDSGSCDPCPTPPLSAADIATLGGDVISAKGNNAASGSPLTRGPAPFPRSGLTLTRLHARYTSDALRDDLIFKSAPALAGGRGVPDQQGKLASEPESGANFNGFQGRYVILHRWDKPVTCESPQRGRWGGPNGADKPVPLAAKNTALRGAPRQQASLQQLLAQPVAGLSDAPAYDEKEKPDTSEPASNHAEEPASQAKAPEPAPDSDTPVKPTAPTPSSRCAVSGPGSTPACDGIGLMPALAALLLWCRRMPCTRGMRRKARKRVARRLR